LQHRQVRAQRLLGRAEAILEVGDVAGERPVEVGHVLQARRESQRLVAQRPEPSCDSIRA